MALFSGSCHELYTLLRYLASGEKIPDLSGKSVDRQGDSVLNVFTKIFNRRQ
jgi:hypothetical protein